MSLGAVEAGYPVALMVGTVTSINPLEVNVDQRLTLPEDFLLLPESLTAYEIDLSHTHSYDSGTTGQSLEPVVIRRGLEVDDVVLLLRVQGGQQFVILDRVVQV
jgi:hypothetical protein